MIYNLNFVPNHGLYQLHRDVLRFFDESIRLNRYDANILYTNSLRNLVDDSPELRRRFRRIFRLLNEARINKARVHNFLEANNQVIDILTKRNYQMGNLPNRYGRVKAEIVSLFNFLWDNTIKTVTCNNNYGSIDDHYVQFYELNSSKKICAFCGVEKVKRLVEQRNEYDHYLFKSEYPWTAINFHNLVPMCDTCNKSPNKGKKNMVIKESTGNRRLAYYPYSAVGRLQLTTSCRDFLGAAQKFNVRTNCIRNAQAFVTWKDVFRINIRFEDYTNDMYWDWLNNLFNYHNENNTLPTNVTEMRQAIRQYRSYRNGMALQEGDHLEFSFWNFLEVASIEDLRLVLKHFADTAVIYAA